MFGQEGRERIKEQRVKIGGTYQDDFGFTVLDKGSGWKPQGVDLIYEHQTHKFHTGLATRWDLWPNNPEDSLDDPIDYGTRFGVREAWDYQLKIRVWQFVLFTASKPYRGNPQEITPARIPKDFFHRFSNREELTRRKKKKLERQLEQDGWTRNQEGLVHQHVIVRFGEI
jgi:hypothetical protein